MPWVSTAIWDLPYMRSPEPSILHGFFCPLSSNHRASPWQTLAQHSILTFQVSDEGDRLDSIAAVGKGLDHVVLHETQHAEASLVTYSGEEATSGEVISREFTVTPLTRSAGKIF